MSHRSAMAEGWGDDEINTGIAHLQSRHAGPERSAAASALPRRARTCPQEVGKPACLVVCRFGPDPPGFSRHLRKHGDKNGPKCAYARNRRTWKLATRMPALRHSWLKAKPVASTSWGVGCRACRWYCRSGIPGTSVLGKANPFVHMQVGGCSVQVSHLHRHARTKIHRLATEAMQNGDATGSLPAPAAGEFQELLERLRAGGLESTCRGDRKKKHYYGLVFVRSHAG